MANTIPAVFWTMAYLLHDKDALEIVQEELHTIETAIREEDATPPGEPVDPYSLATKYVMLCCNVLRYVVLCYVMCASTTSLALALPQHTNTYDRVCLAYPSILPCALAYSFNA
jgi:hypothetical protein